MSAAKEPAGTKLGAAAELVLGAGGMPEVLEPVDKPDVPALAGAVELVRAPDEVTTMVLLRPLVALVLASEVPVAVPLVVAETETVPLVLLALVDAPEGEEIETESAMEKEPVWAMIWLMLPGATNSIV